jgi:hypothetical protein
MTDAEWDRAIDAHQRTFGWWAMSEYTLADLENEDTHVTNLMGRFVEGSWEYAVTSWRHLTPHKICSFDDTTLPKKYRILITDVDRERIHKEP